ncbi:MAG: hypothetical protein OEZ02_10885, partial [Anaerolineae bacterium]|nr:hypothetical protein [Anaerolineae bacterium]
GWLWGPGALGAFVSVLRRRRYDWAWHTNALQDALHHLAGQLPAGTPFLGLVTESEAGFDAAVILAAHLAGFELHTNAIRPGSGQSQMLWQRALPKPQTTPALPASEWIQQAGAELLLQRAEPSSYLHLQTAAMQALAAQDLLAAPQTPPAEQFTQIRAALELGFTYRSGFLRYANPESALDSGKWWLRTAPPPTAAPLADRVEIAIVNHLMKHPGAATAEIDAAICAAFPALLTPGEDLVQAVLESYAQLDDHGGWQIRPADLPPARRADLEQITAHITALGSRLGYQPHPGPPLAWQHADGQTHLAFHVIASALLEEIIIPQNKAAKLNLVVLPGGRANLVIHKLARDPRLHQAVEQGWLFIKYRHIRRLAENYTLTKQSFDELLHLDPLTADPQQIPLL